MAAPFDGPDLRTVPDLRVGEIRALRTFRLGPDGTLLPVAFSQVAWTDGPNTAKCNRTEHAPAAPGCTCGFYAYGSLGSHGYPGLTAQLLAVVACWGRVVPGTLGLRAQHARIEAVWLAPVLIFSGTKARVRHRYPSVVIYRSREAMLRHHPLTQLDSYSPRAQPRAQLPQPSRPGRPKSVASVLVELGPGLVMYGFLCVLWMAAAVAGLVLLILHFLRSLGLLH